MSSGTKALGKTKGAGRQPPKLEDLPLFAAMGVEAPAAQSGGEMAAQDAKPVSLAPAADALINLNVSAPIVGHTPEKTKPNAPRKSKSPTKAQMAAPKALADMSNEELQLRGSELREELLQITNLLQRRAAAAKSASARRERREFQYAEAPKVKAFIKNFSEKHGTKRGAIPSAMTYFGRSRSAIYRLLEIGN